MFPWKAMPCNGPPLRWLMAETTNLVCGYVPFSNLARPTSVRPSANFPMNRLSSVPPEVRVVHEISALACLWVLPSCTTNVTSTCVEKLRHQEVRRCSQSSVEVLDVPLERIFRGACG